MPVFTPKLHSIIALLPVLTKDRRRGDLVKKPWQYVYQRQSPIPVLTRPNIE